MGVESYTVQLTPEDDSGTNLTVAETERILTENGFHRRALRTAYGPAQLTAPPEGQTEYEWRDPDAVIEAVLYWHASPGEPSRADRLNLTTVEVRFAVCQPPVAEERFREILKRLLSEQSFTIHDGYQNRHYRAQQITSFWEDSAEITARLRQNWQRLFGPGYEPCAISTSEAWGHYISRKSGITNPSSD